jgi:hypothetical protein
VGEVLCGLFTAVQTTTVNLNQMVPDSGCFAIKDIAPTKMDLYPVISTGESFPWSEATVGDTIQSIDFSNFDVTVLNQSTYRSSVLQFTGASTNNLIGIYGASSDMYRMIMVADNAGNMGMIYAEATGG